MSTPDRFEYPELRYRRFGGGYRREDVELHLVDLRVTLGRLAHDLSAARDRKHELEGELAGARSELGEFRSKEHEFAQAMAAALRGAAEIEENATARAREITSKADEAAEQVRSESHRLIESSRAQLDELGRLTDELVASMRKVVGDFDHAIARVERDTRALPSHLSDLAGEARRGRALRAAPAIGSSPTPPHVQPAPAVPEAAPALHFVPPPTTPVGESPAPSELAAPAEPEPLPVVRPPQAQ